MLEYVSRTVDTVEFGYPHILRKGPDRPHFCVGNFTQNVPLNPDYFVWTYGMSTAISKELYPIMGPFHVQ